MLMMKMMMMMLAVLLGVVLDIDERKAVTLAMGVRGLLMLQRPRWIGARAPHLPSWMFGCVCAADDHGGTKTAIIRTTGTAADRARLAVAMPAERASIAATMKTGGRYGKVGGGGRDADEERRGRRRAEEGGQREDSALGRRRRARANEGTLPNQNGQKPPSL